MASWSLTRLSVLSLISGAQPRSLLHAPTSAKSGSGLLPGWILVPKLMSHSSPTVPLVPRGPAMERGAPGPPTLLGVLQRHASLTGERALLLPCMGAPGGATCLVPQGPNTHCCPKQAAKCPAHPDPGQHPEETAPSTLGFLLQPPILQLQRWPGACGVRIYPRRGARAGWENKAEQLGLVPCYW